MSGASARRCARRCPACRCSSRREVLPEIREFERASTTAVCAVRRAGAGVLSRPAARRRSRAGPAEAACHGIERAACSISRKALRMPAMAVESGPAAGVIAASLAGRQLGLGQSDLVRHGRHHREGQRDRRGEVAVTAEYEVGGGGHANRWMHGTGHPIRVPVIDLAEVSAGGGSIAWIDPGGALKVGPHSAGAEPGPAAMAQGGTAPTVTDADVVLGYLDRERCSAARCGSISPRRRAPSSAQIAEPLGSTCRRPRRASSRSSTPIWRRRCASSRSSAATTRRSSP